MLRLLLFNLIILFSYSAIAQDYWDKIDQSDGLIGSDVSHFIEESPSKWWVATDFGISLIDNGLINNYPIPNLSPAVIFDLELAQGKLWIATNNGLYSFDGTFQNYGLTSGFKSLEINTLAANSNGDLWIGTDSAVSMYDGQNFVRHDSLRAEYLQVDGSDRVHAFRFNMLLNFPNFNYVFDNNQWVDYGGLINQIYTGSGYIEANGEVYLIGSQDSNNVKGIWELDYPNLPVFQRMELEDGFGTSYGNKLIKDISLVIAATNSQLFISRDSVLSVTNLKVSNNLQINRLAQTTTQVILCTDQGLFVSNKPSLRPVVQDSLDLNTVISKVFEFGPPFSSSFGNNADLNNGLYLLMISDEQGKWTSHKLIVE